MNIQNLETLYLKAKISYYEGNPIMSDLEFDVLEKQLKDIGSKVIEQVGSKRKDFDFPHPNRMLSLAKLQTEVNLDGTTNYQEELFQKWYQKRTKIIGTGSVLLSSPKFDGNAINIIYHGYKLHNVLTRGDGTFGKDITQRFKSLIPDTITTTGLGLEETDILEIRCEVVINVKLFEEKYASEFSNPRNYVAGVIGKDDEDLEKMSELSIIPLHYILNNEHVSHDHFKRNLLYVNDYNISFIPDNYIQTIKSYEELRKTFKYQLDGVVISFPIAYRKLLGENDHDPEFSIAVKFIPDGVVTEVEGIQWNVSKTGELTPVVLLKPVQLAGTIVKRASGYNAGYILDNQIGLQALVVIQKAGDIIPEIKSVITSGDTDDLIPYTCPSCQSSLEFDGIHLICQNDKCVGKISKKLSSASNSIDLMNVGSKTLEPFAQDFQNLFEVMRWVLKEGHTQKIERYGIKYNSRSHEIFVNAFKNLKSLTYEQIIVMLGFENVGKKLSIQLAKEHAGIEPNYSGLEKALIKMLHEPAIENYIKQSVSDLEALGVIIERPKSIVITNDKNIIYCCLTGSPKSFGFKIKEDFLTEHPEIVEVSITDKNCQYLITDSYTSTSSKMKVAEKKGIIIKTYGDFKI